jgi:hypothetical protein
MANGELLPAKNLGHNVVARVDRDPHTSLTTLAERYFLPQVAGQAVRYPGRQAAGPRLLPTLLYAALWA